MTESMRHVQKTLSTILVVDDERSVRLLINSILCQDYIVIQASTGQEAFEIACCEKIDLILLDINMPDFHGFDVCRKLKNDPKTALIPIIFVTANNQDQDEIAGLKLGAIDYLTKPIRSEVLRVRIQNHLAQKKLLEDSHALSLMDPVTGISNRRHFEETFEIEWRRALRSNSFVTVAMIDVDSFKLFNDKFGHVAGDDCLRQVARCLAGTAKRSGDLVARYGGEEFAVISTSVLPEQAKGFGEMFRTAIEKHSKVTISIGIVTRRTKEVNCKSELIQLADQALYKAKCNGKNCLVVHDDFGQMVWDKNLQPFAAEECGVLLIEIRTRINQLLDFIKNCDQDNSQYAMLSIVTLAHRIQLITYKNRNQTGYAQADLLFQSLTNLSLSLNKVWNLPENEQAILWNELLPLLQNISKRLEKTESFH